MKSHNTRINCIIFRQKQDFIQESFSYRPYPPSYLSPSTPYHPFPTLPSYPSPSTPSHTVPTLLHIHLLALILIPSHSWSTIILTHCYSLVILKSHFCFLFTPSLLNPSSRFLPYCLLPLGFRDHILGQSYC